MIPLEKKIGQKITLGINYKRLKILLWLPTNIISRLFIAVIIITIIRGLQVVCALCMEISLELFASKIIELILVTLR